MTESDRLKDEQQFWKRVSIALKQRDKEARERHPTPEQMTDYLEGLLKAKDRDRLAAHFQTCESCSEELSVLRRSYSPPIREEFRHAAVSKEWSVLRGVRLAYALPIAAMLLIALLIWDPMMLFHDDVRSITSLGEQYLSEGKYSEASAAFSRAITVVEGREEFSRTELARIIERKALARMHEGLLSEAEELYQQALDIREAGMGKDALSTGLLVGQMAELRRRQGDEAGATRLQGRSEEILAGVSRDTLLELASQPTKRVRKYAELALVPPLAFRGKPGINKIPKLLIEPDVSAISLTITIPGGVVRSSVFELSLVAPSGGIVKFSETFSPTPSGSRFGDDTLRISLEKQVFPQLPGRYTVRLTDVSVGRQGKPAVFEYTFDLEEQAE